MVFCQGVKVVTLGRQNERNSSYNRLAHTSIFGLCFMSVCLMKSNCYSLIYSSLAPIGLIIRNTFLRSYLVILSSTLQFRSERAPPIGWLEKSSFFGSSRLKKVTVIAFFSCLFLILHKYVRIICV